MHVGATAHAVGAEEPFDPFVSNARRHEVSSAPGGAFYAYPNVSAAFNDQITCSLDFAAELLGKGHVAAVPGDSTVKIYRVAFEPGARTLWQGHPLLLLAARAEPGPVERPAGTVRAEPGRPLRIATGDGWLVPLRLQRAGGKALDVEAFLRGRPIPDGARLGDTAEAG